MKPVAKTTEAVMSADQIPNILRRAFTQLRNGRGGPTVVEVPTDVMMEELTGDLEYQPVLATRYGPDPAALDAAAEMLAAAERPVVYAGQGVHYAEAWSQLRKLAEMLASPVCTSLGGKSAFDETHPLALGAGGLASPKPVHQFLRNADVIFGVGCSFTETNFGIAMPAGKRIIQATLDPLDLNKDVAVEVGLIGDAALTLEALAEALEARMEGPRDAAPVAAEIDEVREKWLAEWMPKLTSTASPLNPYRVWWDLPTGRREGQCHHHP